MRLDKFIAQKFYLSREKARVLIKEGKVSLNERVLYKPSLIIKEEDKIILQEMPKFVSRAGEKLYGFLNTENLAQMHVLDVGASCGGFTQVALLLGAKCVHSIDVGKNQFDTKLRQDPRVEVFEQCDIRDFKAKIKYDLLLCDLSFISIEKIFDKLKKQSERMILLFKPQFEVGKDIKRDKKGVVKDKKAIDIALQSFRNYLKNEKYVILREQKSTLKGKAGNEEFFFFIKKQY